VAGSLPAWWIAWLWCRVVRRDRRQTRQVLATRVEFDAIVLQLADLDQL
jgi:hypothetical protein